MAGVLLAGLVILFPVTRAEAQDYGTCAFQGLYGVRADTTLIVDGDDRAYPRLTATTEYKIPLAGPGVTAPGVAAPGVAALLGRTGDKDYEAALWCFLARRPLDQLARAGEYRQRPPVVRIKEAAPATNGKEATLELVLLDEVTGDLTSSTAPPLLGPWAVTLDSDFLQLQLKPINKEDYEKWRPRAFNSMSWTVRIQLSGLRFHQLEPKPVSTDGEREALWEPLVGDKSGAIRASVNLDVPNRIAIASGSGVWNDLSHASLALANAIFFYVPLLVLLFRHRKTFTMGAACWIPPVLGIVSGVSTTAAY
ncbi:MAG: DUF6185 family protein [Pseudonocardia sp.]